MSTSRRYRVALIVGGFPDRDHPISNVFTLRTAQALSREVDLEVIVLRAWLPKRKLRSAKEQEGLRVTTLAVPQLPRLTALNILLYQSLGWPLVKHLLRSVDVIHSGDAASIGAIAGAWALASGRPHVAQVTQAMSRETVPHLWTRMLRRWPEHVDAIACNSASLATEILKHWPDLPNVRTVYRGVDLELFRPDGKVFGELPQRAGVRFLYAGGFPPYANLPYGGNTKGGRTLMSAWKSAEAELHARKATLIVAGPACDRPEVRAWLDKLAHPDAVRVLGAVSSDAMPALLRSCDAVLVPSLQEGLPNIAIEASATARAVIGSDIPPMREVVDAGRTGVLVPPGDITRWAETLIRFADDAALQEFGRAARLRMERQFDHRRYVENMLSLYETAMTSRGSRRCVS